jgi:transcription elongation factor
VREYLRISEEEREAVERANVKLPNPSWVRIKHGKYKGAIAYVFDSEQSSFFVKVLVPPRDFPYPMPRGSVTLLDSSRLPRDNTVTDIIYDEELVGCSYKGSKYYKGLLLKDCHRYLLEYVSSPHVDDIRLHLQSGWDTLFMKQTIVAFSMQFLRTGDAVRVIKGGVHSEIGTVLSIDYTLGSACLELTFDGDKVEMEVRLQDLERVFRIGDTVRVVAGAYLGLEGHVIQVSGDIFHLCQDISKEEVGF